MREEKKEIRLTVYFEDPFWVGIFEKTEGEKLSVAKMTFGAEPRDYEVAAFVDRYYYRMKFSNPVKTQVKKENINPKRKLREARKQSLESGIGTKSQQALKLQYEENKLERKQLTREMKEAEKERQFDLKQQKRKEKHRGH